MFDWDILNNAHISNDDQNEVLFKYIESTNDKNINPNQYSMYQMPIDIHDMRAGDTEKLLDLVQMVNYLN